MICGLGIREAIRRVTGLPAQLKWPNDIMVRGRKAGGILTEMSTSGGHVDYAVVGIGLNVNLGVAALPDEFHATSIQHELGQAVSRVQLLQQALLQIEERYQRLRAGHWPVQDWAAALETLGQRVQLHSADGTWQGLAESVDEEGALCLRLDNGQLLTMLVGDIRPQQNSIATSRQ
jgi:BirA family biotin operon repressor/biotin-[acetyl-CoA-carboxylase] ligase